MPKINRKTADPEILHTYEELRYDRRYPRLYIAANVIRVLAYGSLIPIFFVPAPMRPEYLKVWMVVVGFALVMELALMVLWQPPGRRLKSFALIVGVIGTAALMLAGVIYGLYRLAT